MLALRVILKMENNGMLKSRPRYQQPFSLADISFYHLTISSPSSTASTTGLLKGKDRWLTRAAHEDQVFQTLQIHRSLVRGKSLLPNSTLHLYALPTSRQRDT